MHTDLHKAKPKVDQNYLQTLQNFLLLKEYKYYQTVLYYSTLQSPIKKCFNDIFYQYMSVLQNSNLPHRPFFSVCWQNVINVSTPPSVAFSTVLFLAIMRKRKMKTLLKTYAGNVPLWFSVGTHQHRHGRTKILVHIPRT